MVASSPSPVYALPTDKRPPKPWSSFLYTALFIITFDVACLMINGSQFVFLLPLRILPFRWSKQLYNTGIRYTKGAFVCLQSEIL